MRIHAVKLDQVLGHFGLSYQFQNHQIENELNIFLYT